MMIDLFPFPLQTPFHSYPIYPINSDSLYPINSQNEIEYRFDLEIFKKLFAYIKKTVKKIIK